MNTESNIQFLARMIVATREGGQIPGEDARRLSDTAQFGPGPVTTMPEERREGSKPLSAEGAGDVVVG